MPDRVRRALPLRTEGRRGHGEVTRRSPARSLRRARRPARSAAEPRRPVLPFLSSSSSTVAIGPAGAGSRVPRDRGAGQSPLPARASRRGAARRSALRLVATGPGANLRRLPIEGHHQGIGTPPIGPTASRLGFPPWSSTSRGAASWPRGSRMATRRVRRRREAARWPPPREARDGAIPGPDSRRPPSGAASPVGRRARPRRGRRRSNPRSAGASSRRRHVVVALSG